MREDELSDIFGYVMTKIEMDIDQELVRTFTENKSELISKFKELIKSFKFRSSKSATGEDINNQYQYEDIDIQAILASRIKEETQHFPKPVQLLGAVDNISDTSIVYRQLEQRLQQDQKEHTKQGIKKERIILIPCNLGLSHWVGILVEFQEDGKIARAEYIDSLTETTVVPQSLQDQWSKVYKNDVLQIKNLLKQKDMMSCGVYTIENLLLSARNVGLLPDIEIKEIRQLHLQYLNRYNVEFYQKFYHRQKNNKPTTRSLHQQLGYLSSEVLFSKLEINRILAIKKCLASFSDKKIKEAILHAFKPKKGHTDNTKNHLNVIRTVLQQHGAKLKLEDQKLFQVIINLLFRLAYQYGTKLNLTNVDFQLGYEEILAVTKKIISEEQIDSMQKQIQEQIKEDEVFAKKLQTELWKEPNEQTTPQPYQKRTRSQNSKESEAKSSRSEGSAHSDSSSFTGVLGFSPIFSTPARNSSKRDSGASALLTTTAITERHILLSYILSKGKISIIINSGQRPNTVISGSQGDHVTAYTTLLQTLCGIVDGEEMYDAPLMLYEAAKCFIGDSDRLKEFDKLFAKKQQDIERQLFPREMRKSLTYNLREINKHAKSIISSVKDKEIKKALQFLSNNEKSNSLDVELLRDTIKHSNQALFAQFAVEVGNQLLKDYNREETAALPKINIDKDRAEGNRVKNAMKTLRLFNKLVGFKQELSTASDDDKKKIAEDFKAVCKNIIETSIPHIKNVNENFRKFLFELGFIQGKDLHIHLENIEKHIDEIDFSKLKLEIIGRLFNDLFDFKHNNVAASKRGQHDGEIVDGKIVFQDPEDVLYKVVIRHIRFMFIAFKDLNILNKEDKEKIIKGFLEWVVKEPQNNDNSQGWGNYKVLDRKKRIGLHVEFISNKIQDTLSEIVDKVSLNIKQCLRLAR